MSLFKDRYRIESARLRHWDYSAHGYYFVTICTRNRECILGAVADGTVLLSPAGEIVAEEWRKTAEIRHGIDLDVWVIMPNHLHGIIVITDERRDAPLGRLKKETFQQETFQRNVSARGLKANSLGAVMGQFKAAVTKRCGREGIDFGWQARFYDHIIRNDESLNEIRKYIAENPVKWTQDEDNSANLYM